MCVAVHLHVSTSVCTYVAVHLRVCSCASACVSTSVCVKQQDHTSLVVMVPALRVACKEGAARALQAPPTRHAHLCFQEKRRNTCSPPPGRTPDLKSCRRYSASLALTFLEAAYCPLGVGMEGHPALPDLRLVGGDPAGPWDTS